MLKQLMEDIDEVSRVSTYQSKDLASADVSNNVTIPGIGGISISLSMDKTKSVTRLCMSLDKWAERGSNIEILLKDLSTIDDIIAALKKVQADAKAL